MRREKTAWSTFRCRIHKHNVTTVQEFPHPVRDVKLASFKRKKMDRTAHSTNTRQRDTNIHSTDLFTYSQVDNIYNFRELAKRWQRGR